MADKMDEDQMEIAREFAYGEVPHGDAWEHAHTMKIWFQNLFEHLEAVENERDQHRKLLRQKGLEDLDEV